MGMKTTGMAAALLFGTMALTFPYTGSAGEKITKPWVTGYLRGDSQKGDTGGIDILNEDDWATLTHIVHHAAGLNSDGTLDMGYGHLTQDIKLTEAIRLSHNHEVNILFSVNNFGGHDAILKDDVKRKNLIDGLIAVLKKGYDGLDIDLEPITPYGSEVNAKYETFIAEIHARMKEVNKQNNPNMRLQRPLLALASGSDGREAKLLARLQDKIDQINIMAYDMSTVWNAQTWHDSALYSDGGRVSANDTVAVYTAAGIPKSKLGMGISLELRIWEGGVVSGSSPSSGMTAPRQTWSQKPISWVDDEGEPTTERGRFANLMDANYKCVYNRATSDPDDRLSYSCAYSPSYYKWDNVARMPYLSINNTGTAYDMFISYNDPRSVSEKVNYVKSQGLGGIMIWDLGLECLHPSHPSGTLDRCASADGKYRPIMKAIRQTLRTGTGKFRPLPVTPP